MPSKTFLIPRRPRSGRLEGRGALAQWNTDQPALRAAISAASFSAAIRLAGRCSGAESVDLPMSRQDIADYLGLTIETVSRTLTLLEQEAAIALPSSRHIVLRNRAALRRLNA